ncbi:MAG: efflux transporter outer membrane subunit [Planctomycetota bacterium]|nr:efflux transporter outer membrane subunit [Planctomycetota bacterium]
MNEPRSAAARPALAALALSLGLVLVAGCTVGPDYKAPDTKVSDNFGVATQPATQPASQSTTQPDLTRWWESFNDPALNKLVAEAVKSNLDLKLAQARVRQARADLGFNEAGLFPTLDGGAGFSRSRVSKNANPGVPVGTRNLYQAGFDAGWEIDVFGGNRRAIESAQYTLEAQTDAEQATRITLLAEVARNYVLLRGFQHELAIVRRNVATQEDTLSLQRQKFDAGIASDLTVAQAEALVTDTRAQIPPLEAGTRQAIHRLGVLLGQEPASLVAELIEPQRIPSGPPTVPAGLPSELLRRRPDVRQAERGIAAATASIGVATADLFPKFTLNGTLGLSSAKASNFAEAASGYWSVGPAMTWRLFDAGRIRANIRSKEAVRDQHFVQYQQVVLQALSEVEDALVAYDREQARQTILRASVASNRRSVDLATKLNGAGVVDFLNVLATQQALLAAEDQLARSDQAVSTNLVALYKALGGGWETTEPVAEAAKAEEPRR